jgi:alkanesulfonate monooxygenase SsuD/methylene tetrahydromethanopterin reductase-like flavin-dependent oxidoreductase (luciferase family)
MVTSNRLRLPTLLAKMAATVDIISGGRLIFGIGSGGSRNRALAPDALEILRRDFDAYGVDVVPTAEAVAALDEAIVITRRLWREVAPFDFEGRGADRRAPAGRGPAGIRPVSAPCATRVRLLTP